MTHPKWLLIGGETLAGKEIRELVEARKLPVELVLASAEASERILTESDGELFVIAPLDAAAVKEANVIILAGATATHRLAREMVMAAKNRPALVDATGALEDLPEARLCAPVLEHMPERGKNFIYVPAHPVALALARILKALKATPAIESVATVFEPASERGTAGIDELHKQTINLFNFKRCPRRCLTPRQHSTCCPAGAKMHRPPWRLCSRALRTSWHLWPVRSIWRLPASGWCRLRYSTAT